MPHKHFHLQNNVQCVKIDQWMVKKDHMALRNYLIKCNNAALNFFCVVPSNEESSFQPHSMVCTSVIMHFTHYK